MPRNHSGSVNADVPTTNRAQPEIQQLADRLLIANAAAELALNIDRRQESSCTLGRLSGKPSRGTLQIDDVQVLRTLLGKLPGNVRRLLREDGFLLIVALPEPDALSAPQINCRPDLHRKPFRRKRRPSRPKRKSGKHKIWHTRDPNGKWPQALKHAQVEQL